MTRRFVRIFVMLFFVSVSVVGGELFVVAEDFTYDSGGRRSPFVSANEAGFQTGAFRLRDLRFEGTIADPKESYAIINSQIVGPGDQIGGFTIQKVEQNQVVLEKDGEAFALVLRRDEELLQRLVEGMDETGESAVEMTRGDAKAQVETLPGPEKVDVKTKVQRENGVTAMPEQDPQINEELKKLAEMTKKRLTEDLPILEAEEHKRVAVSQDAAPTTEILTDEPTESY